jgi:DNA-binding XRE family transcriptional regulator
MDIDWHIGDVIAKLRKRRRMNQTVLAGKVGVSKATIVRAEDGDPKVSRETYMNIARVLGIDLAALEVEAARLGTGTSHQPDVSGSHTRTVAPSGTSPGNHVKHRLVTEAPSQAAQKKGRRSRG